MRLILITGGVVSGLGKGITGASIGMLMRTHWYRVSMIKMDPYLQVDAGTMSPYEHGEVFVTDDGAETDLDFGHYQRFVGSQLTKDHSITSGKIYLNVITKERAGEYLGQTVQVIPHITDEIKMTIRRALEWYDIGILEIGGTIWDIEAYHFIEAMRQMRHEIGRERMICVHVAPLIYLPFSGEYKTKAIQHSLIKLRELGISPDILMCRTDKSLDEKTKQKLALFSDVDGDHIIENLDQHSIYSVPLTLHDQWVDQLITQRFYPTRETKADLTVRTSRVHALLSPMREVHVGIAGKYTSFEDCYLSVLESIKHAGALLHTKIIIHRIDTTEYEDSDREQRLITYIDEYKIQWILLPWGFGSRGTTGMIHIAWYCMQHDIPYLGICLWLQIAVIAYARLMCELTGAHSTELDPDTRHPVVDLMSSQVGVSDKWGTMRLWSYPAILQINSLTYQLYKAYGQDKLSPDSDGLVYERHRHRYEVNPAYHETLIDHSSRLIFSGLSPDGLLVEHIELKNHAFFLATQAHPEFCSSLENPHPLFVWWVKSMIIS